MVHSKPRHACKNPAVCISWETLANNFRNVELISVVSISQYKGFQEAVLLNLSRIIRCLAKLSAGRCAL